MALMLLCGDVALLIGIGEWASLDSPTHTVQVGKVHDQPLGEAVGGARLRALMFMDA
jgi:hypothetical protein